MPIKQWLYFDALECLPEDKEVLREDQCLPVGDTCGTCERGSEEGSLRQLSSEAPASC